MLRNVKCRSANVNMDYARKFYYSIFAMPLNLVIPAQGGDDVNQNSISFGSKVISMSRQVAYLSGGRFLSGLHS